MSASCGFSNCAKQLRSTLENGGKVEMHANDLAMRDFPQIIMYNVLVELTWYDRSPWADVFINNVFSTLPSSDGRKISLKDAFPLGGITWQQTQKFH